ncbi:type I glyceraldehyde-3-phosphate dehydrogenase [Candidatus Parcubacteria bacterium]|nr:type I glyceraldehyde-3-phosphate dehydrogenase [Candidatus Parcubacteria bacterium]
MPVSIAINGFGRIGRQFYKLAAASPDLEVVAVNDLTDRETLLHLLKYDSVYGKFDSPSKTPQFLSEKDPSQLPWKKLGVAVVVESTGRFTARGDAAGHLKAGAKKVIISANSKDADLSVVLGVNHEQYDSGKHEVLANCSCTTNCAAPVVKVLDDQFGVVRAQLTTVHAYTSTQNLVDGPQKDLRRARAAALSIIPTTTGAAKAVVQVLPQLKGKLDALAFRVPVACGSVIDLVAEVKKEVTVEEINRAFEKAAAGKLAGILEYSEEPLVSADIVGSTLSAIFDAPLTRVVDGSLVKIVAWYDNEWAYAARLVDLCKLVGGSL